MCYMCVCGVYMYVLTVYAHVKLRGWCRCPLLFCTLCVCVVLYICMGLCVVNMLVHAGTHEHTYRVHAHMPAQRDQRKGITAPLCCSPRYSIEREPLSELGAGLMTPGTCLSLPQWPWGHRQL